MKIFSLLRLETNRILHSRITLLVMVLTLAAPLAGYSILPILPWTTMATLYLANPIALGTLAGTLLFAVLALYEMNWAKRYHMDVLTDSITSPLALAALRLGAIALCALLTAIIGSILYLPFTSWKLSLVFSLWDYIACWFLLLFPALLFGAFLAAIGYQLTQRVDLSLVLVLGFFIFSRSGLQAKNFLWQWNLPTLPALSDDFTNAMVFRTALYGRIVWFGFFGGAWLLTLLFIRRYGKGMIGSFVKVAHKIWVIPLAACLIAGSGVLWVNQPFFDHSPVDWQSVPEDSHTNQGLYLIDTSIQLKIENYFLGSISGRAVYNLENLKNSQMDLFFRLNAGYNIQSLTVNEKPIPFTDLGQDYIAARKIKCTLPPDKLIKIEISYNGIPKIWNVMDTFNGSIVSPNYIDLAGPHMAPTPDIIPKDQDAPISLEVALKEDLTPVTSGFSTKLLRKNVDNTNSWLATDVGVNSISLFAGDYRKLDLEGGGMPIEFYYSKKHQSQLSKLDAINSMEAAIAYCTQHYGPRSFTSERPFKIIQGTQFLFGGFARQNISVIGEESFTTQNLANLDKGASGADVIAHEIIHQWWGLGRMLMDEEDSYWTDEGITTYTSYRLMAEQKGEAYAKKYYLDKWEASIADVEKNFYVRNPQYLNILPEKYTANIQSIISGVNLYDGTAHMIKRAADLMGGEEELDKVLSSLYQNGGTQLPPYITLNDFLNACGLTKEAVGRE